MSNNRGNEGCGCLILLAFFGLCGLLSRIEDRRIIVAIIAFFGVVVIGSLVYYIGIREKKRKEYGRTLAALQRDPSNKQLRNHLVSLGRWLIVHYGESYSEQSLSNDLMICLSGYSENVSAPNIAEEIQKLAELHSKSIITQEEFERGKSLFFGAPKDKAHQTLEALVNLHQLMKQKVISESEYNVKKWELLSGKLIK